ncbi:MAG: hypothetical protein PF542_02170 [Nanoarchaeota archaeon]|jgi:predicted transcriptional regulator|nr:hypothetical protein [Nanoarchaeota archaeon]
MIELSHFEKTILVILLKKNHWLNASEIAKSGNMSWNTADKYLQKLYTRGWLSKKGNLWLAKK